MSRRLGIIALVLLLSGAHAQAQLAVVDPANLAQAVLIARRAQQHLEELQAQHRTILRMARNLGNMEGYRIPTIGIPHHDTGRWEYGRPLIESLNSGDPTGAGYFSSILPLQRPNGGEMLPPAVLGRGQSRLSHSLHRTTVPNRHGTVV